MAINKLTKDGYAQIELNHVAWRRDGRIEAQCALDSTDFATLKAENGMWVAVDNVARKLFLPTAANLATLPLGIVYTTEHIYDERTPGLKNFATGLKDFYARVGYPAVADRFTTNAVAYDTTEFATEALFKTALAALGTTPLYAGVLEGALGYHLVSATPAVTGPVSKVVEYTTMPDGQLAVKLQVLSFKPEVAVEEVAGG